MPGTGSGNAPGPTASTWDQAARATWSLVSEAVRVLAALIVLRRVVIEIIVAFLGTLLHDQQPESKPFTPFGARVRASAEHNATAPGHHPGYRGTSAGRRGWVRRGP